ncbi:MAG: 23S rRNA (uracil-5-)-methyltransferase RumA [Clostridium sp. SCN 57-10]|nr:MAG: 23S rRNA (uracil-5-)-methyltransferase RumA [Clostridium sp. SCN 57-10]
MSLQKNEIYEAEITAYSSEGTGIARIEGMAVFVPNTARGDVLRVRIVKVLKNYAFGRVEQLVAPSPHRTDAGCAVYPLCGGCATRHLEYDEELYMKRQKVEDALRRIGGFDVALPPVVPSPQVTRYRNKAQFPLGRQNGRTVFGFYRGRSHDVIATDDCPIQDARAVAVCRAVCDWADEFGVSVYDEETRNGILRHVYARCADNGVLLTVVAAKPRLPYVDELVARARSACAELTGVVLNVNDEATNRVLGDRCITLWGEGRLADTLCGTPFSLSPLSFYQVNKRQTEALYEQALAYAALDGQSTVLDLYCGIGTITLLLAQQAGTAVGCEIVPEAIDDAQANAARAGVENARFLCGDAGETAAQLLAEGLRPEVVVCDPPRKGLDAQAIDAILRLAPQRVVYVSCDCATLARDCALLREGGYTLSAARAFDMFPRTAHVETVVLMSRVKD